MAAFSGRFELVISPRLTRELADVLRRPKFGHLIRAVDADAFTEAIEEVASPAEDPEDIETVTRDPDDDYLVALAVASQVDWIVTGDNDLLSAPALPVRALSPRAFLDELGQL